MNLLLLTSLALAFEPTDPSGPGLEPGPVVPEIDVSETGIINGQAATRDDWPMTGGLLVTATATVPLLGEVDGRLLMCSSTLIAPDVVLLAAHCVDVQGIIDQAAGQIGFEIPLEDLEFAWSRDSDLSGYQLDPTGGPAPYPDDAVVAWDVAFPEDWDINELQLGLNKNHDIALMFLDEPVLDVPFAIVQTAEEKDELELDDEVVVVGWGQQYQDANVANSVGLKRMGTSHVAEIANPEFKVGDVADDVRKCHGDSGGPTFYELENTESAEPWRVVGVTSHAYDNTDCNQTGGVDTRVTAYLDWMDAEMRSRCEDGTRSWCDHPGLIPPPDANGDFPWEIDDDASSDAEDEAKAGCGCTSSPGPSATLFALLPLLLIRRRTR